MQESVSLYQDTIDANNAQHDLMEHHTGIKEGREPFGSLPLFVFEQLLT